MATLCQLSCYIKHNLGFRLLVLATSQTLLDYSCPGKAWSISVMWTVASITSLGAYKILHVKAANSLIISLSRCQMYFSLPSWCDWSGCAVSNSMKSFILHTPALSRRERKIKYPTWFFSWPSRTIYKKTSLCKWFPLHLTKLIQIYFLNISFLHLINLDVNAFDFKKLYRIISWSFYQFNADHSTQKNMHLELTNPE